MFVAYFGGTAHTGATYEIIVTESNGTYEAKAFTQQTTPQGTLYSGTSRTEELRALLKQADKKRKGSPRSYTAQLPGTTSHYPTAVWSKTLDANGDLPRHDQLWQPGRPLTLLPARLRQQAAPGTTSQGASTTASQPIAPAAVPGSSLVAVETAATPASLPATGRTATPAGTPTPTTPYPRAMMLCEAANDLDIVDDMARITAMAEPFLSNPIWIATRKIEGRRAQIHHGEDGRLVMTNRSGDELNCPQQIAAIATRLPIGTSLDGELVGLTEGGEEALYAGMAATRHVFVAFDMLACPAMTSKLATRQDVRLVLLRTVVQSLGQQDVILVVEHASDEARKRAMFATGMRHGWEGIVFRDATAPYQHARTRAWTKVKFGFATIDCVAIGIQPGKGRNTGRVGAIECALYEDDGTPVPVGEVGAGMNDAQREEMQRRWDAGERDMVVTVRTERMTAGRKLNRPVLIALRPQGDKRPTECRFSTEVRHAAPALRIGISNLQCLICGAQAATLPMAQQAGRDELAALHEHALIEHGIAPTDLDISTRTESPTDDPGLKLLTWALPDRTPWLMGEERKAA